MSQHYSYSIGALAGMAKAGVNGVVIGLAVVIGKRRREGLEFVVTGIRWSRRSLGPWTQCRRCVQVVPRDDGLRRSSRAAIGVARGRQSM